MTLSLDRYGFSVGLEAFEEGDVEDRVYLHEIGELDLTCRDLGYPAVFVLAAWSVNFGDGTGSP